ncbi:MAG: TonB-dependent receptor, partial [Sphingomonadaceae bacterium]
SDMSRRGLTDLDNLTNAAPQVIIADPGSGTAQGAIIVIRGVSTPDANPFADQAVSFNVDGLQVSRGNIRRMAQVDMQQIDVLKGPQALFFGKNSPAGVIAIHTANPTPYFSAKLESSYEFIGDEWRAEGYLSGPISDALGIRVAGYGSTMKGYFYNEAADNALTGPSRRRLPKADDYGGRVTLDFAPSDDFHANLKFNYGHYSSSGSDSINQTTFCPSGASLLSAQDDCIANRTVVRPDAGPNFATLSPELVDEPFLKQDQFLTGLRLAYSPSDVLKIESITGYYNAKSKFYIIATPTDDPTLIAPSAQQFKISEFTQELRLSSSFDGPLNFLLGAYYQHISSDYQNIVARNAITPAILAPKMPVYQKGNAFSAFLDLTYKISPTVELSGGGRYSNEKKDFGFIQVNGLPGVTAKPKDSWSNFSPEATLTWRPSRQYTIYGSYKTGFLSGGFNGGSGNPATDRSYESQKVKGFEAGVKAQSADGRFRSTLAFYRYTSQGLQVNVNINVAGGLTQQGIENAGKSRSTGVEFDAQYRVTDSLTLRGAAGYNRSRYLIYTTACYLGQSIAAGCNMLPNASGAFTTQDLGGKPIFRAPEWTLTGGLTYDAEISPDWTVNLSGDVSYVSGYYTQSSNRPGAYQDDYAKINAIIGVTNTDHGYSIALVGRNLTNRFVVTRTVDTPLVPGTGGTGTANPSLSDVLAGVGRGREIAFRVSVPFGGR